MDKRLKVSQIFLLFYQCEILYFGPILFAISVNELKNVIKYLKSEKNN